MKTTVSIYQLSLWAFVLSLVFIIPNQASAQSDHKSYLLAQTDPDEAYDPFTDYSEFDEDSDEEADINFFRNGRFFTLGLAGGSRGFTGNFADTYQAAPTFGIFITYFFDLRLAMSLGFQTGDHAVKFTTNSASKTYVGNVSISSMSFDLKYYLSTQNVTRGLADLNPYILGGVGQFYRTYTIADLDGYSRDSTMGFNVGAGLEIPLMRRKAFLGLQGAFHSVEFGDEKKTGVDGGAEKLDKTISGDFFDFLAIIGMNF